MTAAAPDRPVAIAVAPNGGRRVKAEHPAIPLDALELAATAAECLAAGASMIHVHVRDAEGRHLLDAGAYRKAIAAIRAEVGDRLIVQITTEALGIYQPEHQIAVLKATRPEAASLALREFLRSPADEPLFAEFLAWLRQEQIMPQIILYEPTEAVRLSELQRRGLVPWRDVPVLYVLGRHTVGQTSEPTDLLPFLASDTPRFRHWSLCAFGRQEAACVVAGALLGGHIRVGFENNLWKPDGSVAAGNAELVGLTAAILAAAGRKPMSAQQLRKLWAGIED
ncbi:3-keto-5-aminohexanoate cleavage protein [Mesorhizobium shangrilense]|uniref:3-keto-5-aminohexanoate cleavage protein n=1 Tax=Mesorhizobium shangrilense TaxID=460060 RepID=A0ABV2DSR9_9HYPH